MRLIISTLFLLVATPLAFAQSTRPTFDAGALELRATQAFNAGNFDQALPMLQQLAGNLKSDPAQADKLAMLQEQIRVCQKNLNAGKPVAAASKTVTKSRTPHAALKPGEILETTLTDLGNFEFDAENGSPIPDDVKALSGSTVRLSGYMVPLDQAENISRFALVPSLTTCPCQFGGPPQIQHTIVVTCPKGKAVEYYADQIVVEGRLTVDVVKDEGYIVSIFSLETTTVKPVAK